MNLHNRVGSRGRYRQGTITIRAQNCWWRQVLTPFEVRPITNLKSASTPIRKTGERMFHWSPVVLRAHSQSQNALCRKPIVCARDGKCSQSIICIANSGMQIAPTGHVAGRVVESSTIYADDQHRRLLLRSAKPVAAEVEWEHQRPTATILPEGHRLVGALSSPSEQSGASTQRTAT